MRETSFADKFSRYKLIVFSFLWIVSFIYVIWISSTPMGMILSINKLNTSFFEVKLNNDQVEYTQTDSMPNFWVPLNSISKKIQSAIIVSEDGKFYFHSGIDEEQLQSAINDVFVKHKKKKRGASTITQQLVKNLYLSKERTISRKFSEILLSIYLESKVTKPKILETYLNVIEYGKQLYGIHDASKFYFNKKPSLLNAREAAFLAMLLPSPVKYSISFKKKCLTPFARKIIDSILFKMKQGGYIQEDEYLFEIQRRFSWEACPNNFENTPSSNEEDQLESVDE